MVYLYAGGRAPIPSCRKALIPAAARRKNRAEYSANILLSALPHKKHIHGGQIEFDWLGIVGTVVGEHGANSQLGAQARPALWSD